jgi:peptide/nickel transport system substrate-binding protein
MLGRKLALFALIVLVGSLILTACEGETVEVTRVVVEKETVIQTVIEKETVIEVETVLETVIVAGTPEVKEVEVTKEVIKEVEVVVEVVVTATPPPAEPKEEAPAVEGVFPRSETLIADMLTGRIGSPSNFNWWVGWKQRDRGMQTLAGEHLWTIDFATGEIVNALATGDPIYNDDFTTMDVPLREGITWSDGEPFTSADLVFTIETLMANEGFSDYGFFNEHVKSVSATDDFTVAFELNEPNSRFHTKFLDRWGATHIMPKHVFEGVEDPITFEFDPFIGTGPYKLHSYDPQGFWTAWEKREDWQNSATGILYGEPKPQYIVFKSYTNEGAKILAQLTHEADVVNLSSDGLKALLAQSDTSRAYQLTYPWVVNNDPCITGLSFNTARPPYDNPDVRWALLLAIDIAEYMGIATDGAGALSPVHLPHLGPYPRDYIGPMQEWLTDFELDLGDGEMFKPYDPDAEMRVVEYAKGRGYVFPEDEESIGKAFGYGWYKYAPEAAEKLLVKNGFSRDADGNWLLPDGSPWHLECLSGVQVTTNFPERNCIAAVQQWKQFGIDAETYHTEAEDSLERVGDFDVTGSWPSREPWGAGPDLYRTLDPWNSIYVKPIPEETTYSHTGRWSSPEMDAVIAQLVETDPSDAEATIALGMEGLKIAVENMPGIPTFGYIGFVGWDETYWTNWPGIENAYTQPYTHWGPFKYMTTGLEPTGN